jgi:hypothetical protein
LLKNNGENKHLRNDEVLHTDNEERNILQRIRLRKANSIGHILFRNCFPKNVIEGMLEVRIDGTE